MISERLVLGVVTGGIVALFVMAMSIPFIMTGPQSSTGAFKRVVRVAATLSYLSSVVAFTVLPLPSSAVMAQRCSSGDGGEALQLSPFAFLSRVGQGDLLLGDPTLWQVALNVALFVPLGYLLWRLLIGRLAVVLTVALVCSLMVELSQGTGLWFIYDCPYRVFDVDDVIANTLGAGLGTAFAVLAEGRRAKLGE